MAVNRQDKQTTQRKFGSTREQEPGTLKKKERNPAPKNRKTLPRHKVDQVEIPQQSPPRSQAPRPPSEIHGDTSVLDEWGMARLHKTTVCCGRAMSALSPDLIRWINALHREAEHGGGEMRAGALRAAIGSGVGIGVLSDDLIRCRHAGCHSLMLGEGIVGVAGFFFGFSHVFGVFWGRFRVCVGAPSLQTGFWAGDSGKP